MSQHYRREYPSSILNEVLSITAQELQRQTGDYQAGAFLNEVLSITAQE